jgi:anti-sigma B factor antagonist
MGRRSSWCSNCAATDIRSSSLFGLTESDRQEGPSFEATARLKAGIENGDETARVVLDGELDLATVPVAEQAINRVDANVKTLVLDLRKLSFLDSSGLRLILSTDDASGSRRVVIVRGPAQVDRVFDLTGTGARLNMVDDPSLIDQS